jgi:hypothetical protein
VETVETVERVQMLLILMVEVEAAGQRVEEDVMLMVQ